jgi:hypothetical protein
VSRIVIPSPNLPIFWPWTVFGRSASSVLPMPFTEPGDVAGPNGELWFDAFGDRLVHGEMTVSPDQAQVAAQYMWEIVSGSEHEGKVTVRRSDPYLEQA